MLLEILIIMRLFNVHLNYAYKLSTVHQKAGQFGLWMLKSKRNEEIRCIDYTEPN